MDDFPLPTSAPPAAATAGPDLDQRPRESRAPEGEGQSAPASPPPAPKLATANPIIAWLLTDGFDFLEADQLLGALARQLVALGLPLMRMRLTLRTLHPQFIGTSYTWTRRDDTVQEFQAAHEILQSDAYLRSPYVAVFEGAGAVRRRLDIEGVDPEYPILRELKADGATDYVAIALSTSDGRRHAITFAADRPGGFHTQEMAMLDEMVAVLSRVLELHVLRRTARTILDTYLGRHSGQRVLSGLIKRGDGETIHAVIWFSDLRGSTGLAERLPREQFLALLNDYFEGVAGAVLDHGGEVLRYIGDAALAIFPIGAVTERPWDCPEHVAACLRALDAARQAQARIEAANADREARGDALIRYGIGLHLGDVLYGNIGTRDRLEFSVIGSAANEAARLENLCKRMERPLLISEAFARVCGTADLLSLGFHAFKGLSRPQEVFTLKT